MNFFRCTTTVALAMAACCIFSTMLPVHATAPELQGNVVEIGVTLNNLRDARLSVSRARKASANLYDEVTRQQMTMDFNPNMIGTTVINCARITCAEFVDGEM